MEPPVLRSAVGAARHTAAQLGLRVDDAVVLHNSNRIAVRLLPCDVLVRVSPEWHWAAEFEVEVARKLAATGSPAANLDSRVEPRQYRCDDFRLSFWTYYEPLTEPISPPEYADALRRLHGGLRQINLAAPHFTDRVSEAHDNIEDPARNPELPDADRELLIDTLRTLTDAICARGAPEQLLHGEPHEGNVLHTQRGPLFIDFETVCRGPLAFDVAHAPDGVAEHYPDIDHALVRDCRILKLAMITSWRWDPNDQLPNGRQLSDEWLGQLRAARAGY